jgi:UDPglucose--hexose-1-phosphate uridylyltransferase
MPQLRTDWLTGRTVIIAENRANRPNEFTQSPLHGEAASTRLSSPQAAAGHSALQSATSCPFCVGNESKTPPSVYQTNDPRGRWQVRVVPNMFPAVELRPQHGIAEPASGAHEVIIESSRHEDRMSALSIEELRAVLAAYADRLAHWHDDGRFRYGLLFKNQGQAAGASLAHVHSQLVALENLPPAIERELKAAQTHLEQVQGCAYCRLCEQERTGGARIVLERDGYLAFCPYASLQPLEVWVLPTDHQPWFERAAQATSIERLAGVLHLLFKKVDTLVPGASYNMLLRTAPWQPGVEMCCHWRIELLPRFNPLAGLELATGVHINPVPPELAARRLQAS